MFPNAGLSWHRSQRPFPDCCVAFAVPVPRVFPEPLTGSPVRPPFRAFDMVYRKLQTNAGYRPRHGKIVAKFCHFVCNIQIIKYLNDILSVLLYRYCLCCCLCRNGSQSRETLPLWK